MQSFDDYEKRDENATSRLQPPADSAVSIVSAQTSKLENVEYGSGPAPCIGAPKQMFVSKKQNFIDRT
jgi:hypothetical protein